MSWHASLLWNHSARAVKTAALFEYSGPLRILQSLCPESDGICRDVIVHPTGGPVGVDTLDQRFDAAARARGLVTAPGVLPYNAPSQNWAAGTRLKWLSLETIACIGCLCENRLTMDLPPWLNPL